MSNEDAAARTSLPPGYDENDPYEDDNLSAYPDWWKKNILEYQEHDLRPYRPPRFSDGELTPKVIDELESELDIQIQIRAVSPEIRADNPQGHDGWTLYVDGEPVTELERRRVSDGYTKYALSSEEFASRVRRTINSDE